MTTEPKTSGGTAHGRFVSVRSLDCDVSGHRVIITCDGGNVHFQHGMTPAEARELAGYLQDEANYCEQENKEVAQ